MSHFAWNYSVLLEIAQNSSIFVQNCPKFDQFCSKFVHFCSILFKPSSVQFLQISTTLFYHHAHTNLCISHIWSNKRSEEKELWSKYNNCTCMWMAKRENKKNWIEMNVKTNNYMKIIIKWKRNEINFKRHLPIHLRSRYLREYS